MLYHQIFSGRTYCSVSGFNMKEKSKEWWMLEFSTDVQVNWLKIWNRMDNNGNFEDVINGIEVS